MVLNPVLYDALTANLGRVRVSDENTPLSWLWDTSSQPPRPRVDSAGEQYYCCCPICGDKKYRLAIGHRFLTPLDKVLAPGVMDHNFRCYNEGCDIREHPSYRRIQAYVQANKGLVGIAVARSAASTAPAGAQSMKSHRLPNGFVRLGDLDSHHPAWVFIREKYGFDPLYLSRAYSVGFCTQYDPDYPDALHRIVFPLWFDNQLVGWQARSLNPADTRRWVFPGGSRKILYNWDSLPLGRGDVVVITEGIPAAIAAGPTATAIFGKELDSQRINRIVQNFRTAVIATDPETFYPDPMTRPKVRGRLSTKTDGTVFAAELKIRLDAAGLKVPALPIRYPSDVLEVARKAYLERLNYQTGKIPKPDRWMSVPDPADIGMAGMQELLKALPISHRPRYLC